MTDVEEVRLRQTLSAYAERILALQAHVYRLETERDELLRRIALVEAQLSDYDGKRRS